MIRCKQNNKWMMNEGELEFCNIIIFSAKVGFDKFCCSRQVDRQEYNSAIMFTLNRTLHSDKQEFHCNTFMMYTSITMHNLVSTC